MTGTLLAMMYVPLIVAAVVVIGVLAGLVLPYHAPAQAYTGDPAMP
jgi:hypothetical protein